MEDNLKLWKSVEKTNPKYTKQANVKGNKITSIAPQYQIMNVTERFGIYGQTWGFKSMDFDYTLVPSLGLVVLHAIFYFPNGEFPIKNAISLFMDNAKTKVDDNFAKKIETDTLTKAISKLGFNADIFMGKFDDQRYLEDVTKEFSERAKVIELTPEQLKNNNDLENSDTLEVLKSVFLSLSETEKTRTNAKTNKLKDKLTSKSE
jgi:hypothetical protein